MRNPLRPAVIAVLSGMTVPALAVTAAGQEMRPDAFEAVSLVRLDYPWGMAALPDGTLLITEKPGNLRLFADGLLSDPIAGVPEVAFGGQGGLLDVALDPDFATNRVVYLSYAEAADEQPREERDEGDPRLGQFVDSQDVTLKGGAVARGRLEGARLTDVEVIWRQVPKMIGRGHFGGRLVFSPDGTLFITSGDRMRFEPAQDLGTNLGKIVRINPDGTIPPDNPFVNRPGARPDIWAFGLRNPLGAAVNRVTGQLWVNDMGPMGGDEVNVIEPGRNYGWPLVSAGSHYNGAPIPPHYTLSDVVQPIHVWVPSVAPSGFAFYGGGPGSTWHGNALMGGLVSQAFIRLTVEGEEVTGELRFDMRKRIRDVMEAEDGSVLLLSDGPDGELIRLMPTFQAATAR